MPSLNQRNRMVVFRLSQAEYDRLRAACVAAGGRSLSDFTRSGLLTMVETDNSDSVIERKFVEIDRKLNVLQALIQHVSESITPPNGNYNER
jgi:hypothetical protein